MRGHIRDRYGVAVDAAIYAPHDYGDDRNHHAHVMTTTRVVDAEGLWAKTRQLDVGTSASAEAIREQWAEQVNDAPELAQVAEQVDHWRYARQGIEMELTVKMGHASAAIERRAYAKRIAAGEEPHAVTPRGQMNEAIEEKRGLGVYLERGQECLQEMRQRVRDQAEQAAHGMASLVQGAARAMRAGLQTNIGDEFDALPAFDQSPRQQQTPALDHGQDEHDRQRQRGHDREGPDIGQGR